MAIIDMKKVLLIGLQAEKEKILGTLQLIGNVEIVEISGEDGDNNEQGQLEASGVLNSTVI